MTERKATGAPVWLGQDGSNNEPFGGGDLWIGQHAADQDILVFDPSESDPSADVLTLYSLTQHRTRSFPRALVLQKIHTLTEESGFVRARTEYAQRLALRAAHEQALAEARTERRDRERDAVLASHRRYIEALGLEYQGVHETAPDRRPGRRTRCYECEILLDDFAGAVCQSCQSVLCSCGACACGKTAHAR